MFKPVGTIMKQMEQGLWEASIKRLMLEGGWTMDRDNETTLGFTFREDNGDEWIRDYDKKSRTFVHFNGSQKINLVQSKDGEKKEH